MGPTKDIRFLGPSKNKRFQEGKGPSKNMRFLGPTKDMRFQEGKHKMDPSNEMRFKILSQICLSPSMHMKFF